MSPYLMAFVVCDIEDFDYDTYLANNNIPIRIWARRRYIDEEYGLSTLELTAKIYNELQDIFRNVDRSSLPAKIGKIGF
jgi:aminopeptidase N